MIALYDSVLFGMRYYITQHNRCTAFAENVDLWDAASLFQALVRAGVFDDPLTFNRFHLLVERTIWQRTISIDISSILRNVEMILARLGVMPIG